MISLARWLATPLALLPTFAFAADQAGDGPGSAAGKLDPGIRKMIETAIAKGDEATIANVLAVARQAAPEARDEIDRQEQAWQATLATQAQQAREEKVAKLRKAGLLDNWKGEVEVGGSRSTGSSNSFGLLGSLDLKREGVAWTHKLSMRGEMQSTNGDATTERLFAAWQPNYRFHDRAYAYGLVQYERDPFAGYDGRFTLGGGLGYRPLDGGHLKLEIEGGPALRRVDEIGGGMQSRMAGRGSLNLNWRITPTLSFTQKTAVFVEGRDGNLVANTGLDTKLIGNLKARFSYDLQYERYPPIGASALNTQSRATFVYGF